ncbi:helix-turn-helix domain-containing protein [Lentibacter sp. XHP0401]|jgi:XRE family transcriptional regulator, regulator of sulfur utilization|uniref:helix-turn-helix domain-containing protein n=1 Tax=Lentibacter sp. XHP0401 TaxID=2984334 RepID=UPI0021E9A494|nr:XRE family transcriptional regulator [Lentibacter sp. XHP0401]MCV2891626.1 XRE family transcriptional regulator [Lentibacter sp. XHP0401]
MAIDHDITRHLASRLKEARTARGLSLEALAQLSGVSRSMLSQIERGASSPTVASLWNLTRALGVDFAGLLDSSASPECPILEHLRSTDTPAFTETGKGCTIRILSAPADVGKTELYELVFDAGGSLVSEPHDAGAVEHLTVLTGALSVRSGEAEAALGTGDTLRYRADLPHAIRAHETARAILVVKHETGARPL